MKVDIVGDETLRVFLRELLNHRMPPRDHAHLAGFRKSRARVAIVRRHFRQRHRDVQFRDRRGRGFDSDGMRARHRAKFLEDLALQR